jgi:hypothetical protein
MARPRHPPVLETRHQPKHRCADEFSRTVGPGARRVLRWTGGSARGPANWIWARSRRDATTAILPLRGVRRAEEGCMALDPSVATGTGADESSVRRDRPDRRQRLPGSLQSNRSPRCHHDHQPSSLSWRDPAGDEFGAARAQRRSAAQIGSASTGPRVGAIVSRCANMVLALLANISAFAYRRCAPESRSAEQTLW